MSEYGSWVCTRCKTVMPEAPSQPDWLWVIGGDGFTDTEGNVTKVFVENNGWQHKCLEYNGSYAIVKRISRENANLTKFWENR